MANKCEVRGWGRVGILYCAIDACNSNSIAIMRATRVGVVNRRMMDSCTKAYSKVKQYLVTTVNGERQKRGRQQQR